MTRSQEDRAQAICREALDAAMPAILDRVRARLAAEVGAGLIAQLGRDGDRTAIEVRRCLEPTGFPRFFATLSDRVIATSAGIELKVIDPRAVVWADLVAMPFPGAKPGSRRHLPSGSAHENAPPLAGPRW